MNKYLALQKDVFDINKVTVVGSPTITSDGVASGFLQGSQTYVQLFGDGEFDFSKPWQLDCKINTGTIFDIGGIAHWFLSALSATTRNIVLGLNGGVGTLVVYFSSDGTSFFATALNGTAKLNSPNTDYYIRIIYDLEKYLIQYSTDGINYYTDITVENSLPLYNGGLKFGNNESNTNSFQGGSVYLTETKLRQLNQLVYTPTKPTYLLERRKPKVWNKGQFAIVGSPSISEDGVYTCGYGQNNYVKVPFNNTLDSFSLDIEINILDRSQAGYYLGYSNDINYGFMDAYFNGVGTTDFRIRVLDETGTFQTLSMGASNYLIGIEKINLTFTGTQYILTRTRADGVVYTNTVDSTFKPATNFFSLGYSTKESVPYPTINLKKITNTSDNNLVFDGGADTYVYDPNKFTVVGTPTITEYGVASEFGSGNQLKTNYIFKPDSQSWKIQGEFTTGEDITTSQWIFSNLDFGVRAIILNGAFRIIIGSTRYGQDISNANNNPYILKAKTTYSYLLEYNATTKTYTREINDSNTVLYTGDLIVYQNSSNSELNKIIIGSSARADFMAGSIDLPSFSITVDGKEVFTGAKENYYMLRR